MKKIMWLTYRKLRPAVGIPAAFTLMSGFIMGVVNPQLVVAALGLLFIDLFGNFYNDYWDFKEDVRGKRKDKFTTSGVMSRNGALTVSAVSAAIGFCLLLFSTPALFALGLALFLLLLLYSHEAVRFKGKLWGYLMSFPYFFLPFAVTYGSEVSSPLMLFPLSFFFYFQCIYILCQKDSTDMKDESNLFLNSGWEKSVRVTEVFAALSFLSLMSLSLLNPLIILACIPSTIAKMKNLNHIRRRTITKERRGNFMLVEFASHYISLTGGLFL